MSVTLQTVSSGYNLSAINDNFQSLQTALNNNILWRTGSVAGEAKMSRDLDMDGNSILNIGVDLENPESLLTLEAADLRYYNIVGDVLEGPLDAGAYRLTNLGTPVASSDAARKGELDSEALYRQNADANLQAQISETDPLMASAFSEISWHGQEIGNSVTIPDNRNAWSFGPQITIEPGQLVTIGDNSTWTIANGQVFEGIGYDIKADTITNTNGVSKTVANLVQQADLSPINTQIASNTSDISSLTTRMSAEETKVQSIALGGTGATTALSALSSLGALNLVSERHNRGISATLAAAAASLSFTADELVVSASATGNKYLLRNVSASVNVSTTGAGGMDTGTVPAAGFVAIYAIYNPITATTALLAVNATSAAASNIYSGANMPSGYTASQLISVWRTASSLLVPGTQREKVLAFPRQTALSGGANTAGTATVLSLAPYVPLNAKRVKGHTSVVSTSTSDVVVAQVGIDSAMSDMHIGYGNPERAAANFEMALPTAQTIYRASVTQSAAVGTVTQDVFITGYTI